MRCVCSSIWIQPDYWLAHRLADLQLACWPTRTAAGIGAGPFRLTAKRGGIGTPGTASRYYHLQHPYLSRIEYWITPELQVDSGLQPVASTRCGLTIGQQEDDGAGKPGPTQHQPGLVLSGGQYETRRAQVKNRAQKLLIRMIQQVGLLANLPVPRTASSPPVTKCCQAGPSRFMSRCEMALP
jgi:MarR-like DNA-binding transcriptional regulator SgrR of sgrS sRNA